MPAGPDRSLRLRPAGRPRSQARSPATESFRLLQTIRAVRGHGRETFGDERAVAAPGFCAREAGHARELAGDGQSRSREKTARDLAQRDVAVDPLAQPVRKSADPERPDVRELRLIVHL